MTHTYALLAVSPWAYDEIKAKLLEAGYQHAINDEGEIDMHGIALVKRTETWCPFAARRSDDPEYRAFCQQPFAHDGDHLDGYGHKHKHWVELTPGEILDLEV